MLHDAMSVDANSDRQEGRQYPWIVAPCQKGQRVGVSSYSKPGTADYLARLCNFRVCYQYIVLVEMQHHRL